MRITEFLSDKSDITKTRLAETDLPDVAPRGHALLAIDKFALTANNITYGASGDVLGYWRFFPAIENWGKIPVWGYADVVLSAADGVELGERIYGFFPMASHVLLRVDNLTNTAFSDLSPHRADLAPVYNRYARTRGLKNIHEKAREDSYMIFHPLYATSYLLYDFLMDNDYFGAERVIVGSASSKTGLGLLSLLSAETKKRREIVALTSKRNGDFVRARGWADEIRFYDDVEALSHKASVYIDMSGNMAVRKALHHHLTDNMKHSCAVGMTHWDKFERLGDLPGAKPSFFFAPTQIAKRDEEWGRGVLEKRILASWRDFTDEAAKWFGVRHIRGGAELSGIYAQTARGEVSPDRGYVASLLPSS